MNKNIIIVAILIACVIPSVSHASWWNPYTWRKAQIVPTVIQQAPEQPMPTAVEPITTIKTVTVEDPSQQARIEYLEKQLMGLSAENERLQAKIESLQTVNAGLQAQIALLNTNPLPPVATKTKDQLQAQYKLMHPRQECPSVDHEDSRTRDGRCGKLLAKYVADMGSWVNMQLINQ